MPVSLHARQWIWNDLPDWLPIVFSVELCLCITLNIMRFLTDISDIPCEQGSCFIISLFPAILSALLLQREDVWHDWWPQHIIPNTEPSLNSRAAIVRRMSPIDLSSILSRSIKRPAGEENCLLWNVWCLYGITLVITKWLSHFVPFLMQQI